MPMFSIDFRYTVEEYGNTELSANNKEDAEAAALEYIKEFFPDVSNVEITEVREID